MSIHIKGAFAGVFSNRIATDPKVKRAPAFLTDVDSIQRKALNKALRIGSRWEPCCPHLDRQAFCVSLTTASAGIHQQIAEPPCAATIRQSETKKPHLVAPSHR